MHYYFKTISVSVCVYFCMIEPIEEEVGPGAYSLYPGPRRPGPPNFLPD